MEVKYYIYREYSNNLVKGAENEEMKQVIYLGDDSKRELLS